LAVLEDRKNSTERLAGAFRAVRGDPVISSPEEDQDFKNDISRLGLTSNQQRLRERQLGPDDAHSPEGRDAQADKDMRDFQGVMEQAEALRRIDAELARIRAEIDETHRQYLAEKEHLDRIHSEQTTLNTQEQTILQQQQALLQQIADADRAVEDTRQQAAEIDLAYNLKKEDTYGPNGEPRPGEPDPIREREARMNEEEYQRHRDEIKAEYEARGLGKEFEAQEKLRYGGTDTPENNQALGQRIHAAGLSSNLDAHLLEVIRRNDPNNPYLQTLNASFIDVQRANEINYQAREKAYDLHGSEIQLRLDGYKFKLEEIRERKEVLLAEEAASKARMEDLSTKEAQLRRQELETLALRERELNKNVKSTTEFQEKYNLESNRLLFLKGKMTMAEYEQEMEKAESRGYIDNGTACINPTAENKEKFKEDFVSKAELEKEKNDNPNNTARTGTSASSTIAGGIESGKDLTGGFNAATTWVPPTEDPLLRNQPQAKPGVPAPV